MIHYKADETGLTVIVREESYTSKASALDCDAIPNYGDVGEKVFSGKRKKRGLYVDIKRTLAKRGCEWGNQYPAERNR
ncbi:ISSoc6, OrfB transposase [Candidatus Regiella insecticola 5.15]|uniref:ISSoc6, OrfB transposase n=2 Tax=Candidatus Regiella insecticola TaxID=138073 RepID=G2GWS2_9ENTR|nr:hypothetical protein [Candidatus Regiella insecticola]EGY29809.1 ISSoc6, OrfB transposase [Candidatus Regiella insecticola 5.15]